MKPFLERRPALHIALISLIIPLVAPLASAGVVNVGKASYSDAFPGTDEAGRNGFIKTAPYVSGKAANTPVPTNDWWSNELVSPHASAIFNYPMTLRPEDNGLVVINNMQFQAVTADSPVTIGVEGISARETTVCDYSDWTVTIRWENASGNMDATIGLGMPMIYFTKSSSAPVVADVKMGSVSIEGNIAYIDGSYNRASYALYAPAGSVWTLDGQKLSSTLNGKNYWTVCMLPEGVNAREYGARLADFAFVFPQDTRADWNYDPTTGTVTTNYRVTPDVKEGTADKVLMGILPHQWGNLGGIPASPGFLDINYSTVRGKLRLASGNEFSTLLKFHGVLPYLPMANGTSGFSPDEMKRLVKEVCDDHGFQDWTDSYNDGQLLNRLVQTAEAAKAAGDEEGFKNAYNLVKKQLERWLTFTEGDKAFMFFYHAPWSSMLGYPAGHGQDNNLNDHNFHWGYFIRAAALIAQYDPEWVNDWGEMINLLVRDVASHDRNDKMFPYLRAFSPYAGHCWANGTASLSLGNDQESTSEAMQFNTALILWGDITGDTAMRDLGVYLYVTELSSIEEYWFDVNSRNHAQSFHSALASRVFGNSYDDENFWGGGIAGSYGIQIYPLHAGSFYLMNNPEYAAKLWNAMSTETDILANDSNPNIWYDTWLRFLAMQDAEKALSLYKSCTHLGEKFGESQAHTYQWLNTMAILGKADMELTATHPLAMAFENDGLRTYIARNNSDGSVNVKFSDGYTLNVAPHATGMATSGTISPKIILSFDSENITEDQKTTVTARVTLPEDADIKIATVELLINGVVYATVTTAPYTFEWIPEEAGTFKLSIRATTANGDIFESNETPVTVKKAGKPDILSCTFNGIEASEGIFNGEYTIVCSTKGSNVEVQASFAGNYTGLVAPWFFDETNGFKEVQMTDAGNGTYVYTFSGVQDGTVLKFRVKIAYAGGLGVTKQMQYEAGSYCDAPSTGIDNLFATSNQPGAESYVVAFPNPAKTQWTIYSNAERADITIWNLSGVEMERCELQDGHCVIDAAKYPVGIYILQINDGIGIQTQRLIKN